MEHAYKSHTIGITTWASLDRNGYTRVSYNKESCEDLSHGEIKYRLF
jgi:hypothetical protein